MEPSSQAAPPLPDHFHSPMLHAGFWQRFAAYLIDCLILIPAFFVLEFVLVIPLVAADASSTRSSSWRCLSSRSSPRSRFLPTRIT